MSTRQASIAANRFGLGPKPGELASISSPKQWLLEQLEGGDRHSDAFEGFASSSDIRANYYYRYVEIGYRKQQALERAEAAGDADKAAKLSEEVKRSLGGYVTWVAENLMIEFGARTNVALATDAPFRERLVRFWSNHLVVPAIKQQSSVLAGAYEREVIRPHVTGKFADMLMASAKNPGMLVFLDNYQSIGPNSRYGRGKDKGINENLAREILELHTMGVEGGYSQADVIALSKALTGWSTWPVFEEVPYLLPGRRGRPNGAFIFYRGWHEPGDFELLGKVYDQRGAAQGEAMLNDLARRPETARFLAFKLAQHFVDDAPSETLVNRLADVYLESDTDLGEMTRALIESEEAWREESSKLKQPEDYAISCLRALGIRLGVEGRVPPMPLYDFEDYVPRKSFWAWLADDKFNFLEDKTAAPWTEPHQAAGYQIAALYRDIKAMGQPPMNAPGPQGWYDTWEAWSGSDSLVKRIEWALGAAITYQDRAPDARAFLTETLGARAPESLTTSVSRAATLDQGLGLILASPAFQRR